MTKAASRPHLKRRASVQPVSSLCLSFSLDATWRTPIPFGWPCGSSTKHGEWLLLVWRLCPVCPVGRLLALRRASLRAAGRRRSDPLRTHLLSTRMCRSALAECTSRHNKKQKRISTSGMQMETTCQLTLTLSLSRLWINRPAPRAAAAAAQMHPPRSFVAHGWSPQVSQSTDRMANSGRFTPTATAAAAGTAAAPASPSPSSGSSSRFHFPPMQLPQRSRSVTSSYQQQWQPQPQQQPVRPVALAAAGAPRPFNHLREQVRSLSRLMQQAGAGAAGGWTGDASGYREGAMPLPPSAAAPGVMGHSPQADHHRWQRTADPDADADADVYSDPPPSAMGYEPRYSR
jgi:hypothetical protein